VVAVRVGCGDPRVKAMIVMGFPASMLAGTAFLASCRTPSLFVQGARDAYADGARIRALVGPLPEPKTLVVVPDADHFFAGRLEEMQAAVFAWAATRPWEAA
jgi:alpha/beta superfamily hydrolase